MQKIIPLTALLSLTLTACGGDKGGPEAVARQFIEAQMRGDSAEMIRLATDADRAAATQAPNTTDSDLYRKAADQALFELFAKRVKVQKATAQVNGENAQVQVPVEVPDVNLGTLMLGTLFGGAQSEDQARALLSKQIEEAPVKTDTQTVNLVKVGGEWRVDTLWAERAEAKKREDAERAKEEALQQVKQDYEQGLRQDFRQADAALRQLVKLYPNDKGWAEELTAMQTLLPRLGKLTVNVKEAGIYQGEYRIVADVRNGSSVPLQSFTVKYTFVNGTEPVGEPQYETFKSADWFSTRVLDVGGNVEASATGTPAEAWTGEKVRAEVTAFEVDTD